MSAAFAARNVLAVIAEVSARAGAIMAKLASVKRLISLLRSTLMSRPQQVLRSQKLLAMIEQEADENQPLVRDVWDPRTYWGLWSDRPERQMVLRPTNY